MSNYLRIKPLYFILYLSIIILISGKITQQYDIDNNNIPSLQKEYKHCEFNNENNPKFFFSENKNEFNALKLGYNQIKYQEDISYYKLDLSKISDEDKKNKDLLIYTNFTEENIYYYFGNSNNIEYIPLPTFDLVENTIIQQHDNLTIVINSTKKNGEGFIDFSLEIHGFFEVNKNITREVFYNKNINIEKSKYDSKYYINLIPKDNNSDAYFIQFSSSLKKEKDKLKLYYLNSVNQGSIKEVKTALKNKPLKRDKKINGKIEIFCYEYSDLEENGSLTLEYNRIKGEGIAGFITSISTLFFILIIIVIIFLKNTYS
jgi:hypothetical protein